MTRQIKHRNVNSIWLYDYTQFENFSQDRDRVLFLSMMDMNLIWNAIQNIALLQTRVYTEAEGQLYTMVDDTQFETFQGWVSDLRNHLGEYLVTNQILADMLIALQAIADKPCCPEGGAGTGGFGGGSRGAGIQAAPASDYDENSGTEIPPAGFTDWAEYREHKCNMAHDIVRNLKVDLLSLSNIIVGLSGLQWTGIVSAVIGALITPIPYDDVGVIVGLLTVAAFQYSFLASLSAEVQNNAQSLICTLYNSPDAVTGQANLLVDVEGLVDDLGLALDAADWLKSIVGRMITYDSINKLFTPGPTDEQAGDCSSCGGSTWVLYIPSGQTGEWGSIEIDGLTLTGTSELGDTCNRLNIKFVDGTGSPALAHITTISTTGATHPTGFDFYKPDGSANLIACPSDDCQNTEGEDVYEYALCSDTAFSLFIEWSIP